MGANSSIFGTFARTYPISLKLNQNIENVILIKNQEKKLAIIMAIWPKLAFKIKKIGQISKIAKISKVSERHEIFFHGVIFIVDFEYELRFDKNYAI